jgi:Uma2 family endonuclease
MVADKAGMIDDKYGQMPDDLVAPDLVFEVRSPSDSWRDVLAKVIGFFERGVKTICVIDLPTRTIQIYSADDPPQTITLD